MRTLFAIVPVLIAALSSLARATEPNKLNLAAGSASIYEVQVRTANACREDTGAPWQREACRRKVAPVNRYRAENMSCGDLGNLHAIKLGTFDDMMEDTDDYRAGITLRYIKEKVGATTIWLMPLFPNNDRYSLPDACDNLGSPYGVRDYMHASGRLDRACIVMGRDESTVEDGLGDTPCWGNWKLDALIAKAHDLGLKVMLDVALNHFGHNYQFYDYASFIPVRERISRGDNLDHLWDFQRTYESDLLYPEIVDTVEGLERAAGRYPETRAAYEGIKAKCPHLKGDDLVRAFGMWREMLDWERARFRCDMPLVLEYAVPGFYASGERGRPSRSVGDNYTNNWVDVKFLFHHENRAYYHEFARNREYFFRIMNYWVSRGIDGFRLDHTTDGDSGMSANEWKYLIGKVDYYDWVRKGRPRNHQPPIYLAEEFHDQLAMNNVVDIMTEGYVGDIRGSGCKGNHNTSCVERALRNDARFNDHAYVMRALETHDEHRLFDGTGFDIWTGAGFWAIGAANRGTPMLLMGQEFGEPYALGFRRSDFLRSRFVGTDQYRPQGDALVTHYGAINRARRDHANRALLSSDREFLRPTHTPHAPDERILAEMKWSSWDGPNVVFAFHNLWPQDVSQTFFIAPEAAAKASIHNDWKYKLVDAFTGRQMGDCRWGADIKNGMHAQMSRDTRFQWLRMETCL